MVMQRKHHGYFSKLSDGIAEAVDQIRHQVAEQPWFWQQTTGNIELPQVEAPAIEPAGTGIIDLTSPNCDPSWGVATWLRELWTRLNKKTSTACIRIG